MSYTQLTQGQRYQISALLKMGHNRTEIAEVIEAHKSTVSRELGRKSVLCGYRPKQAHRKALNRPAHPVDHSRARSKSRDGCIGIMRSKSVMSEFTSTFW